MKRQPKKQPSDYPVFSLRIAKKDKERLIKLASEECDRRNKKLREEDYLVRMNDVILDALKRGFRAMGLDWD